jgi:hypothetical protein
MNFERIMSGGRGTTAGNVSPTFARHSCLSPRSFVFVCATALFHRGLLPEQTARFRRASLVYGLIAQLPYRPRSFEEGPFRFRSERRPG